MKSCVLMKLFLFAMCMAQGISVSHAIPRVSNREAKPEEIGCLPREGDRCAINPPPLAWLAESEASTYTVELSSSPAFSTPDVRATTKYLLYTHTAPLKPGDYSWRYRYETTGGEVSNWSHVRHFTIPAGAVVFPRPSSQWLAKTIPVEHPHAFIRPEGAAALRESPNKMPKEWQLLKSDADKALSVPLMKEPQPWKDGKWNMPEWLTYYREITTASRTVETLGFAYLVSGEPVYGEAARRWLLNFASWDPLGTTSMSVNDEQGMAIMYSGARAYSWVHDRLNPDDIAMIRRMMRERGNDAYRHLRKAPYDQFAYDSHSGRIWHFLGEVALVFYHEIPEAAEWLDYAMTIFYGWYPAWGDTGGGWAEGLHYWVSYNEFVSTWLDEMRGVLGINGALKPYYSASGYFPMYVAPPGGVLAGFGDFSEGAPPAGRGRVVAMLAVALMNPEWQWFVDKAGMGDFRGFARYLYAMRAKPVPREPVQNSVLKVFHKAGWAIFHSNMTDPPNNVQLMMRASPYGNISHSHSDQNNVVLSAFGAPLLVNTGVRDFYGSPFCNEWYWATRGHNCVLIGGEGQGRGVISAGRVAVSGGDRQWGYVLGDASGAYRDSAKSCKRYAAFVRGEIIVLLDEVDTKARDVELLFHGRAPFVIAPDQTGFHLENTTGALETLFFGPNKFTITQTDKYTTQPEPVVKTKPEWHLTAKMSRPDKNDVMRIVSVLLPHKTAVPPVVSGVAVDRRQDLVTVSWKRGGKPESLVFDCAGPVVKFNQAAADSK